MKTPLEAHQAAVESLLKFTPPNIKARIDALKEDKRREEIFTLIKNGDWKTFLDKYRKESDAFYILLATYCHPASDKHLLTEDELGTAFYFLAAAIDDPDYIISEMGVYQREDAKVPENCRYRISIHGSILPEMTRNLLNSLIVNSDPSIAGILSKHGDKLELYRFKSFSEVKACVLPTQTSHMRLVLGIADRRAYWKDIQDKKTHVSLLTPEMCQSVFIHGAPAEQKGGISVSIAHDFGHLAINNTNIHCMEPLKIRIVNALLDALDRREALPAQLEDYHFEPLLPKGSTIKTLTTKWLDELVSNLITSQEYNSDIYISNPTPDIILIIYGLMIDEEIIDLKDAQDWADHENATYQHFTNKECLIAKAEALKILKPIVEKAFRPKNEEKSSCSIS
jgi:hypothetical protein